MKTNEVHFINSLLKEAKLTKMSGEGKIKVVKILKATRPVASEFDTFRNEAIEKLRPEGFDQMQPKLVKMQEGDSALSEAEKKEVSSFFDAYAADVNRCIAEEGEKEVDITFDKMTEAEFTALCETNDWQAGVIYELMDKLT